jgi:hypothetical protein
MGKLWIFGDSYCHSVGQHDQLWSSQLSRLLGLELKNLGLVGSSQDYAYWMITQYFQEITVNDQIIIVLTSPDRKWFFEKNPDITNPFMFDLDRHVGKDRAKAMTLYYQHLHNAKLDTFYSAARLCFIEHYSKLYNWKKPLVIFGFNQSNFFQKDFENLLFANGNLLDNISNIEFNDTTFDKLFCGRDPRYNHMSLRNHNVLSKKIYNALTNSEILDLTQGFHSNILDQTTLTNDDFTTNELDPTEYKKFLEQKNLKIKLTPYGIKTSCN